MVTFLFEEGGGEFGEAEHGFFFLFFFFGWWGGGFGSGVTEDWFEGGWR